MKQRVCKECGCKESVNDKFPTNRLLCRLCINRAHRNRYYEIDHIRPCSDFDLTDYKEIQKCFHWSNLQILDRTRNRIKGAKLGSNL